MLKDLPSSIIQTLRQHGFQAYLVGGCVRDLLLKREPADYDVATSATPAQVMEIFPDTYAVGAQFGVVLVPLPEDQRTVGRRKCACRKPKPSKWRPSAAISATPTAGIPMKCVSARIRARMLRAAISPSTA